VFCRLAVPVSGVISEKNPMAVCHFHQSHYKRKDCMFSFFGIFEKGKIGISLF